MDLILCYMFMCKKIFKRYYTPVRRKLSSGVVQDCLKGKQMDPIMGEKRSVEQHQIGVLKFMDSHSKVQIELNYIEFFVSIRDGEQKS